MSNEVGKIKVGKLNKQHEPTSRDAVKVLETVKPRSSLQMQGGKKLTSPDSLKTIMLCSSSVISDGCRRCQTSKCYIYQL